MTFGASQTEYLATMESELANEEEAQFNGIAEYRERDLAYNHTPGGEYTPDESIRLNATETVNGVRRMTGAMKGLRIQAGDTVNMEVWAKYNQVSTGTTSVGTFLFAALTGGLGLTETGETALAYGAFNDAVGATTLYGQGPGEVPKAYLNYIFFDDNYENPAFGFQQVGSTAENNFQQLALNFTAPSSGYLYIGACPVDMTGSATKVIWTWMYILTT